MVLPETFAIEVVVEAGDPAATAALANAVVQKAGVVGALAYPIFQARPLDEAQSPARPIRPEPARDLGLAALAGLVLGAVAASPAGSPGAPVRPSQAPASGARPAGVG